MGAQTLQQALVEVRDRACGRGAAINQLHWDGCGVGNGIQVVLSEQRGVYEVSGRAAIDEGVDRNGGKRVLEQLDREVQVAGLRDWVGDGVGGGMDHAQTDPS